jgi:hypothetical protein
LLIRNQAMKVRSAAVAGLNLLQGVMPVYIPVQVLSKRPCHATDDGNVPILLHIVANLLGNQPNCFKIIWGCNREACFYHVHT